MVPNRERVAGVDYKEIPSGVDESRLESIYNGLVRRGIPEDDIIVAMNYIVNESGGDPSRDDEYGKGLLDGIAYRDNMFIEDDDTAMLERQLDSIAYEIENGDIDTAKDIRKTDYGESIRDRIYGNVNLKDTQSILRGGIGWKYSEGGELDEKYMYYPGKNESGVKRYFKGSPYAIPEIERDENGVERIVGMSDITSSVIGGTDALLYDDEFMKNHTVYQDADGRYTMIDNRVLPVLDDGVIGTKVSSDELKKTMPSMDYIGGKDYRIRVAELIPGFMDKIKDKAESYGINPNLVLHRFLKEGFIDNITSEYNSLSPEEKRTYFTDGHLWDESYSGYGELGLDDAGSNLLSGKYTLKDKDARWSTLEEDPENEHGRQLHNVPIAEDLNSALEMVTAELAYRQSVMQKRGIPADKIDAYTNAAFNAGLNSSILKDTLATLRRYSVPDYYQAVNNRSAGGNLYDGMSGSSYMQRSPMWDPNTVLLEMPQPESAIELEPAIITAQRPVSLASFGVSDGFVAPENFIGFERPAVPRQAVLQSINVISSPKDNTSVASLGIDDNPMYSPESTMNEELALGASENEAISHAMKNLPKKQRGYQSITGNAF